jgi:hypothetical protein
VLRAAGYYTVQVPATGEPRPALFARLLAEPGALGTFGQRLLEADIDARFRGAAVASPDTFTPASGPHPRDVGGGRP